MKFYRQRTEFKDATNWQKKSVKQVVDKNYGELHAVLIDFTAEFADGEDHNIGKIAIEISEPSITTTGVNYTVEYNISVLFRDKTQDNDYTFIVNTLLMATNG